MAHATAFFNRETTHFNGCSFFILNSDYKTLQQYMDSIHLSSSKTTHLNWIHFILKHPQESAHS